MKLTITICLLLIGSSAYSQTQEFFSMTDAKGHVSTGVVQTNPDGSQSYMWNDGKGKTDTGYLSAPLGNSRTYSTYDGDTGKSSVGSIQSFSDKLDQIWLPVMPPSDDQTGGEQAGQ